VAPEPEKVLPNNMVDGDNHTKYLVAETTRVGLETKFRMHRREYIYLRTGMMRMAVIPRLEVIGFQRRHYLDNWRQDGETFPSRNQTRHFTP